MQNPTPSISVVIPAFNAEKTIGNSILSVLNQKKLPEEIIIVDDGSTDETVNVVNRYKDRVKLICQRNQGAAVARQTGSELAKSEYIAYLDSDDWWPDNKISRIKEILSSQHIDFLLSDLKRAYPGRPTENNSPKNSSFFPWVRQYFTGNEVDVLQQKLFKLNPEVALQVLLRGFPVFPSTMVVRRSIVKEIGGWDHRFKRCQDFDIGLRIAKRYPLHYLDEVLAILGLHEGNDNEYFYIAKQYEGDVKVLRAHLQITSSGTKHYQQIAEAIGRKYRALGYAHRKMKQYKMARINYAKALLWPGHRAHSLVRYLYCIRT
jgi:glycosyltransferase involved in cell wall biosynthesis